MLRFSAIVLGVFCISLLQGCGRPSIGVTEANTTSITESTPAPDTPPPLGIVCLDPGHPSETNDGRTVQNGATELEINWKVALQLAERLRARNIEVVLTKEDMNEFVTNKQRAEVANAAGADLFLRLHCDTGRGSGFTTYFPEREGHRDGITGPPKEVRLASARAAKVVHGTATAHLHGYVRDNGLRRDYQTYIGNKYGALRGSLYATVPVVLVEMVFLSSDADARFIKSEDGQKRMAEALADGVEAYLREAAAGAPSAHTQ